MKKQEVLKLLERYADEVDSEDLIFSLYLKAKLERAEAAVKSGDVLSHQEVVKRSQEWFK